MLYGAVWKLQQQKKGANFPRDAIADINYKHVLRRSGDKTLHLKSNSITKTNCKKIYQAIDGLPKKRERRV